MSRPLRILILGRDPDMFASPGGAPNDTRERHIAYVRELQRRRPGSEVRIIVHTWRPGGGTFDAPIAGMKLYGTLSRHRLSAPLKMLRLMRSFRREGWDADVVSCQTGYEEAPLALFAAAPASRIQIQVHNDFYGEAFGRERFVNGLQRRVIRRSVRRCDQVRVVSDGIRKAILRSGDIPADRIALAPVPIIFQSLPPLPDTNEPVVLFVGRLVAQKDLGLWCEVARAIHRQLPNTRFWVVGEGPDREIVERGLAELGDSARLFGAVTYDGLPGIYARSSVFLLTSLYEGLGRVIVEAMLGGVPVVSANIVGPQDLIEDRRTGRLVSRDANSLADACVEILRDRRLAREFADAARAWAQNNYSFDAVAAKLVESWEAVAELPKRKR